MVQPGAGRHQEEKKELAKIENERLSKGRRHLQSIELHKYERMLEEGEK